MSANISAPKALIALTALSLTGFFQMKNLRKSAYAGTPAHLRGRLWT